MENKTLIKEWQNWMTGGGVSRSTLRLYTGYIERFGKDNHYLTAQTEDITGWMNLHDRASQDKSSAPWPYP